MNSTKTRKSQSLEESEETVVSSNQVVVKQDKKIKQFDFFFLRTCFRTMNEFYKTEYQKYYNGKPELAKVNLTAVPKDRMDKIVAGFVDLKYGPILSQLDDMQTNMLLQSMMAFVYAHRHNKDDLFLVQTRQENYIDFSVLRDCMYHYSKKA